MKFSVLISLYHKEKPAFFNQAISSIWDEQTVQPSEVILVLDGPIGRELQASVDFWQDKIGAQLKVIALLENIGLGKALNEGLNHCTTEWIFRMDTDDISLPNRFEKQIDFIESNSEVVLFGGQILEFNQVPKDSSILKEVPIGYDQILNYSKSRSPFNHVSVAFKKSVIQEVGGYQHHLFMEDYNLWLRVIGAKYIVGNLPDILLYVRVGNGMYAKRKGMQYLKSEKQLLDLKKKLKLQSPLYANMLFLARASFRLLPASMLGKIYNTFLRKKV